MEYRSFTQLDVQASWYQGLCALHDEIFGAGSAVEIPTELSAQPQFLILVATDGERVVGYKIGYREREHRLYSWIGGVQSDVRSQGIASELMQRQHEWCKQHGYTIVRTQTKNKWRNMLILNLRHGFDVIGTYTDGKGETRIILEKKL